MSKSTKQACRRQSKPVLAPRACRQHCCTVLAQLYGFLASMSSSRPRQDTSMFDNSPVGVKGDSILRTRRLLSSRRIALNATAVLSVIRNRSHRSVDIARITHVFQGACSQANDETQGGPGCQGERHRVFGAPLRYCTLTKLRALRGGREATQVSAD